MNNDYGRHIRRTWVDTHSQSIRTDPEIYLPGELDTREEDGTPDGTNNNNSSNSNNDDGSGPADMSIGIKRKAGSVPRSGFSAKLAKTAARGGPSTAALGGIDDRRPDIMLVDVLVGEDLLARPYGRHGCLYMEMKVEMINKPNPQGAVSVPFRGVLLI